MLRKVVVFLAAFVCISSVVQGAVPISETADLPDIIVDGNGDCTTVKVNGCSLRSAIMQGNYLKGTFTLALNKGTYVLDLQGSDEAAALGDLDIVDSNYTITCTEQPCIIDARSLDDRIFHIQSGSLILDGVTLIGGINEVRGGSSIFNQTSNPVIIKNSSIEQTDGSTSAIFSSPISDLTIENSIIFRNGYVGTAIDNSGSLHITHSTIQGFDVALVNIGVFIIEESALIAANYSINNESSMESDWIVNSTIAQNNNVGLSNVAGEVNILNSTLINNINTSIYYNDGAIVNAANSIIEGCYKPLTYSAHNIVSAMECLGENDILVSDFSSVLGTTLLSQTLAGQAHYPLIQSESNPALGAGDLDCTATDQLGVERGAPCNLGAVEETFLPEPVIECGNGTIDGAEECDGSNLNDKTCASFGFTGGTLSCGTDCKLIKSACTTEDTEEVVCGNGTVEGTEECDGSNLNNKTCTSFGFTGGTLSCGADCKLIKSACTSDNNSEDNDASGVNTDNTTGGENNVAGGNAGGSGGCSLIR